MARNGENTEKPQAGSTPFSVTGDLMLSSCMKTNSLSAFPSSTPFWITLHGLQPFQFQDEQPVIPRDALRSYTITLTVGLEDLEGLFQRRCFYDYMNENISWSPKEL